METTTPMMASSSSPSPWSPRPAGAAADEGGVVIASRCSVATAHAFRAAETQLRARQHEAAVRDIRRKPTNFEAPPPPAHAAPGFVTAVKSPSRFALKTDAARRNDHAKTPYTPPSDFAHRAAPPPGSWTRPGEDFVAKFRLPSNQDLRRRVALDQEGFFSAGAGGGADGPAATQFVASDHPDARRRPRSPPSPTPRPAFQSSVPHTTRKSANIALRIETIVDQDGLLPQLREIRAHKFRDADDEAGAAAGGLLAPFQSPVAAASATTARATTAAACEPFRASFKPAPALRPIGGSAG